MELKSIEEEWTGFAEAIFRGSPPSKTQHDEMKKAFFAGALALFAMVEKIGTDSVSDIAGIEHLESVRNEFTVFMKHMLAEWRERN